MLKLSMVPSERLVDACINQRGGLGVIVLLKLFYILAEVRCSADSCVAGCTVPVLFLVFLGPVRSGALPLAAVVLPPGSCV